MIRTIIMKIKTAVVIPNWNGEKYLTSCINSLTSQSQKCEVIVVENGSVDGSARFTKE
jgi:glycosyltransferase involved in cell wall biosynthesis